MFIMANKPCPECNYPLKGEEKSCPKCGCPITNNQVNSYLDLGDNDAEDILRDTLYNVRNIINLTSQILGGIILALSIVCLFFEEIIWGIIGIIVGIIIIIIWNVIAKLLWAIGMVFINISTNIRIIKKQI